MLIHRFNGFCHWGLNLDYGENTIIGIYIKVPLPFMRIGRWLCFETLRIMWGIRILTLMIYFRMRYRKYGFPVTFDIHFFWKKIYAKIVYYRREIDDAFNKSLGRQWHKNELFVHYLIKGGSINAQIN